MERRLGPARAEGGELEVEATYGPLSLREFDVTLENFTGPFDLLLRLIANRQMDLTEVALAAVTEEFLGYIRRYPDLTSATDFLVVAATLLHMKAASLLPRDSGEDDLADEDLEARDLLFARLLQYKALQDAGNVLRKRWDQHSRAVPRVVPLQEPYASMLPELRWSITKEGLAELAAGALAQRPRPDEADHVGRPAASFEVELAYVSDQLQGMRNATFAELIADADSGAVVVTRFLAVLQLYRQGNLEYDQPEPMGDLVVKWVDAGDAVADAAAGGNPGIGIMGETEDG